MDNVRAIYILSLARTEQMPSPYDLPRREIR